jgi:hypothetical protein
MPEPDDRVTRGLVDLLGRAPADSDIWAATERYVTRSRHRRQLLGATLAAVVLAVFVGVATHSAAGNRRVRVATTLPDTAATSTTVAQPGPPADPCRSECVGRASADVDGDGRPDDIGLTATPALSRIIEQPSNSRLTVRVAFANGEDAEYEDTAAWDASLVGAADVDGSGKAKILYFNDTGASHHMGHILQWDGSRLVAVKGPNGRPFTTFIDGYAMGGRGIRCDGTSFATTSISGSADSWTASENVYRWSGDRLVEVATDQPIAVSGPPAGTTGFYVPPEYDQIIGVHCPGMENKKY